MTKASSQKSRANGDDTETAVAVQRDHVLTDEMLRNITSFADLQKLFTDGDAVSLDISQFGTGFTIADGNAKRSLVGQDLAIVAWKFTDGNFGEFVTLFAVTAVGARWIINDGSAGIYKQMRGIAENLPQTDRQVVIRCPKGLTVSEYTYVDDKGEETPARTFYLAL